MTRYALLALFLCLAAPGAWAQTPEPRDPLPLEQVLREALGANPGLRAATAAADGAHAGADAAHAGWYPRVTVSETWQRGDQPVFVFSSLLASRRFAATNFAIDQLNQPDAVGVFHGAVSAEQVVFDGGARRAAVDGARARAHIADLSVDDARLDLAVRVVEAYGRLLTVQAEGAAARAAVDGGREDLARAARRRDAGVATEAEVLAMTLHLADMEQRVIQAEGDAAGLRAMLNQLAGAAINRSFAAVEPPLAPGGPEPSLDERLADATAHRPELRRADEAMQAARSGERAAHAAFLPHAGVQAVLDLSGTHLTNRASSWLVGGDVRWSLGIGGTERAGLRAAAAATVRASAEADEVRTRAEVDVRTAYYQAASARAREAVGRATVSAARESQRIIRDRYEAGLAPVNDLLGAATTLLDAETRRVSAVVDTLLAQAHLERACGRLP